MLNRLRIVRDRWLADPAIRQRIGKLPMGRRIAERHAARLFGLVSGFAQSQMLAAALEAGVFDRLREAPATIAALADATALPRRSAESLVQALTAMGLAEPRGDAVALTIDGLVIATDPGIRAMIAHNALLYRDLADPLALLRDPGNGALAAFWPYARGGGDPAGYSALMAASQGFVADAILDAVDFSRVKSVVDVGGGDGSFLAALARRTPRPALTLVDLPPVAAIARQRLAEQGLDHRIAVLARGDEPLPATDALTLVRVLHDRDDAAALALLRDCAAALRPGGRLIVAEPLAHAGRDPQAAYFAAYFAAMGSGRLRTRAEIGSLLRNAGFVPVRHSASLLVTVIQALHSRS